MYARGCGHIALPSEIKSSMLFFFDALYLFNYLFSKKNSLNTKTFNKLIGF